MGLFVKLEGYLFNDSDRKYHRSTNDDLVLTEPGPKAVIWGLGSKSKWTRDMVDDFKGHYSFLYPEHTITLQGQFSISNEVLWEQASTRPVLYDIFFDWPGITPKNWYVYSLESMRAELVEGEHGVEATYTLSFTKRRFSEVVWP